MVFILEPLDPGLKNATSLSWLKVMHGLNTLMREKPLCSTACFMSMHRCLVSELNPRATKVAPFMMAEVTGLNGNSTLPKGELLVFMSNELVGDNWPVVRP